MFIKVDQELCAGCGACSDSCSVGAIQLVDQQAVIDDVLCTQCEACISACPNGAITALSVPIHSMPIVVPSVVESRITTVPTQTARPETDAPARSQIPLAGSVLAFLRCEVTPRLSDMLLTMLERRLAQPATTAIAPVYTSSPSHTVPGRGERMQIRYRGRRADRGNHRERR